jgi:hypothetical protein
MSRLLLIGIGMWLGWGIGFAAPSLGLWTFGISHLVIVIGLYRLRPPIER